MNKLPKIVTILGITASGKTGLAIKLAQKFNGEIVSADSRQIYKEFNIGTAKPEGHWMMLGNKKVFASGGIPHHLIDFVDPKEDFSLADYKDIAVEKIKEILQRGKTPFLVGGTALYIKSVLENWDIPKAGPNQTLRKKLENKEAEELYKELKQKDPEAAIITGNKNKRRIVRALEVIYETGKKFSEQRKAESPIFNPIKIGLKISKENFINNVSFRLKEMLENGLIAEVNHLQKKYSWALSPMHSIDYQEFKDYLEGKTTLDETKKLITKHHADYARRQMTWFKKDTTINWVSSEEEAVKLISDFLKSGARQ
jgi:tRNA dimethylallyltransferase